MTGQSKIRQGSGVPSTVDEVQAAVSHALPLWVEGVIIGGIAVGVYVAPTVSHFVKLKVSGLRVHIRKVTGRALIALADKWEPINNRWKRGSIVRVMASFLPDCCFNPPCRMFVPSAGYSRRVVGQSYYGHVGFTNVDDEEYIYEHEFDELDGGTINPDGLIVAFAIDADTGSLGDRTETDTVEIEDTCSNPEGWDPIFQPRANSTRFACSTPEPSCRSSCLNDSFSTQNSEVDKQDVKEELADLRNMVKELLVQMGTLNQTNRTVSASYILAENSPLKLNSSANFAKTANSIVPQPSLLPLTTLPSVPKVQSVPAAPAPPPPPPPPMPSVAFTGSVPLITPRKTGVQKPKSEEKSKGCMSINLRDIKGVQLRPTPKSPGGTPLKNGNLSAHSSTLDLTDVLKKRYQAWHSPTPSEKDFGDKENCDEESAFEDSFMDDEEPQIQMQPNLRPPNKEKAISLRLSNENQAPFGQHLLKKGNKNSPGDVHPRMKVLAEQNI